MTPLVCLEVNKYHSWYPDASFCRQQGRGSAVMAVHTRSLFLGIKRYHGQFEG